METSFSNISRILENVADLVVHLIIRHDALDAIPYNITCDAPKNSVSYVVLI